MMRDKTSRLLLLDKSPEVVEQIIMLNEKLIWKQITKFGLLNDPEAASLGFEALYNAVLTFNGSKKASFPTYATVCIYNRLGSYVRSLNTNIRKNTISYDVCIDDKGTTHLDSFESCLTADGSLLEMTGIKEIMRGVQECEGMVSNERQQAILKYWRESGFSATHREISAALDCSQSYVSQTINKFRERLKYKLEG